jgi:chromosome segregation protein
MRLKRLVIQGFKSFKDRTHINFDEGITGIVGPNGCGKSNIVDALFWVMGEQSAKHLRGNSMKDLIFAGSSKYSPGGFAEATLILENFEGKHIHIGNRVVSPKEIQLTRKLYRNGETEYRINNEPARLKDIHEVFMDTGAGAKSYSIIAQGEINRLVQAKPEERRVMIEEVAGITKFKMRKRESLRKIDATQSNLSRLQDLQTEIEKNLRSLQRQAEKAERARNLKERIKRNDIVVHSHKVFDQLKSYRDSRTKIQEGTLELEGWKTRKNTIEVSLEDERFKKQEMTEQIDQLQSEYNEISKKLAAAEEKLNYLCKTQTEKEKLLETRQKEIEELKEELVNRNEKLESLRSSKEELENEGLEGFDCSDLEEQVETLQENLEIKKDQLSQINEELMATETEFREIDQIVFRNNSRLEEFASSLQDITEEIESLEGQYSGVSKELANEREIAHGLTAKAEELLEEERDIKKSIEELDQEYKKLNNNLQDSTRNHIRTESKLMSLIEVRNSLEGTKDGASEFIKTSGGEGFSLFGDLVQCDEKYAKAVQGLLNPYLKMLVSSMDEFTSFDNWLSENNEKGLDLIIADSDFKISEETKERLILKGCTGLQSLNDLIQVSTDYQGRLESFLEGFFIVDSLDKETFDQLGSDITFKGITSLDGKMLIKNERGAKILEITSDEDQTQGVVERNNMIQKLEVEVEVLKNDVSELEEKVNFQKEDLEGMKTRHDNIREEYNEKNAEAAAKNSALESKVANLETGTTRLEILKNRKSEVSKSRLELLENEESFSQKQSDLKERVEELSSQKSEQDEEAELIQSSYSQAKEELVGKQIQAQSFNQRIEGIHNQVIDIEEQVLKVQVKIESHSNLINEYEEEIETITIDLKTLEEGNQSTAEELEERDDILNTHKDVLVQLLQEMQIREDEAKGLSQKINKTEKLLVEVETKIGQYITEEEQVVRNIFEKYRIDLRFVLGRFLEFEEVDYEELNDVSNMFFMETEEGQKEIEKEEYEFTRRYGQDLKDCEYKFKQYRTEFNRLGEINWQAIEDYERQKLRFDFLKIQEVELKKSLEDLEKAIAHIDEKSRERFKIAFNEVNMRFQKVFPVIFGGGNAQLKITGNVDDAECGVEIIAQPPGKKMQNINLMSGGEKAMTAVSLIFSIFLVKPSPFCLLDEVDAPLDDANVGRFNELLREMSNESQFILITHNKKTMELNDTLYGVTMQEPGISKAVSVQLH